MTITFLAAGTGAGGAATATPGMPTGATTGDLLIIVIEGEGEDATADAVPTGGAWTNLGSVASATDGAVDRTRCTVGWAWYDAAINRVVPDAGDHTIAQIYAFRGVDQTTPIGATTSGSSATNATSHTAATGLTTTVANSVVLLGLGHGDDVTISAEANTSLTGVALGGQFRSTAGSDGTVGLIYGTRAAVGSAGSFTWTANASEERAWFAVELRPEEAVAPGAPTALAADPGNTEVGLSWTAPASDGGSPITDYLVEYLPSGGAWSTFTDGVSSATTATVTGLTNGTSYDFRVSAINDAGTGAASGTATATPAASTVEVELWSGSAWVAATVELWSGSAWVSATAQLWDGAAWVPITTTTTFLLANADFIVTDTGDRLIVSTGA